MFKDKEKQKRFQREWVNKRRSAWITENGPCKICGSLNQLEVDHIDPATKEYAPRLLWSRKKETRDYELKKCQVLCKKCHKEKTKKDVSKIFTGRQYPHLRTVPDEKFIKTLELIKNGLSERKACLQTGLSRGTFTSTKHRNLRSNLFK